MQCQRGNPFRWVTARGALPQMTCWLRVTSVSIPSCRKAGGGSCEYHLEFVIFYGIIRGQNADICHVVRGKYVNFYIWRFEVAKLALVNKASPYVTFTPRRLAIDEIYGLQMSEKSTASHIRGERRRCEHSKSKSCDSRKISLGKNFMN